MTELYNMAGFSSLMTLVAALSFTLVRVEATSDQQIQVRTHLQENLRCTELKYAKYASVYLSWPAVS